MQDYSLDTMDQLMKKPDFLILSIILIVAFTFRLYKINIPLADLHSWRQADTAAVSRNFVKNGIDLFHPIYDDLSNVQSGIDNLNQNFKKYVKF